MGKKALLLKSNIIVAHKYMPYTPQHIHCLSTFIVFPKTYFQLQINWHCVVKAPYFDIIVLKLHNTVRIFIHIYVAIYMCIHHHLQKIMPFSDFTGNDFLFHLVINKYTQTFKALNFYKPRIKSTCFEKKYI